MQAQLNTAKQALACAQALLDQAIVGLRQEVVIDGQLSMRALDQHQLAGFEIAWCAAELTAARAQLETLEERLQAGEAEGSCNYDAALALTATADAIQQTQQRLSAHPQDFGLPPDALNDLSHNQELRTFCQHQLSAQQLAALGEMACKQRRDSVALFINEEQAVMRDTFRKIAEEVVAPLAEDIHRKDRDIPDEIIEPLLEMGIFGLSIPERFGGLCSDDHEDNTGMIIATEELSRGSLGAAGSLITRPEILARALLAGGTNDQQQHWLPKLAAGDPFCAVAVTEPGYGSDVAGMQFRATKTNGGWLLDGTKSWCTFAGKAGVLLVLARSEPDPTLGHRGLSLFLAEKPSFPGHAFEYAQPQGGKLSGRSIPTIGYRGMHTFELFFDQYFVPDDALLGGEAGRGRGFYYMMAGFSGGRIQTAARALGVMQAAFDASCTYVQERCVFGQPLLTNQLVKVKLAQMATLLASSRKLTYRVARLMDQGGGQMEASLAKLFACRAAERLTREAVQLHGGMGYAEETDVSRYFVDARVLSIFEGAEEVLALRVIARELLKET